MLETVGKFAFINISYLALPDKYSRQTETGGKIIKEKLFQDKEEENIEGKKKSMKKGFDARNQLSQ